ncbi:MAG: saccharopine dehydrogenase C-terminal domain-containing protein [Candidatus Hodarchaeales archaeon]|jgi:saccharopine dehydrogenase (NADP+, L-glutamate forming)/spermidine synthase
MVKKVLIFGAGLVSKPMVDYLLKHEFEVWVASRTVSKAEKLVGDHKNGKAISFDITKESEKLNDLIPKADLVVSLLPYIYHVQVAKVCIMHKKHIVTTSYVSDEMKALDQDAKDAGIIILNEIGVDPGIDHMSAMKIIDAAKAKGGKITRFKSYCGGLPAPEANTNPFGYKFSWSPRGVVLAAGNPGLWKKDGRDIEIKEGTLFKSEHLDILNVKNDNLGEFEVYSNRDSLKYIDLYSIPDVQTMFRGTLRNKGWCKTWDKISDLGYLNLNDRDDVKGLTFAQFIAKLADVPVNDIKAKVAEKMGLTTEDDIIKRMEWLGLFSDEEIPVDNKISPLDVLANRMLSKSEMLYEASERDMLVLIHDFLVEYPDGKKEEISSTMIDYGIPNGDSSMSRTVSLPAAVATRMILEEKITDTGVIIPTSPNIYNPVLEELETLNIKLKEEIKLL